MWELIWLHHNIIRGSFSNQYESGQSQTLHYQAARSLPVTWLIMVPVTSKHGSFCSQSAHTPACYICWGMQLLVPPLGNLWTLKSLTFRTSFSVFHCLLRLSISCTMAAMTKTIPWLAKANQIGAKKMHGSAPHSHLIEQFIKQHLVMIRARTERSRTVGETVCQDHAVRSVA